MPTIPDTLEDGSIHFVAGEHRQRRRAIDTSLPLTMPDHNPIMGLPTGLELQDTVLM